jgi:chromosome segregation ATPase
MTSPLTAALDSLFSGFAPDGPSWAPEGTYPLGPPAPIQESEPPPSIESPADLRAAREWLRRERECLKAYTQAQLARLQQQQQSALAQNYHAEQSLILRVQELNRREEFQAHQAGALAEQKADLEARAAELEGAREELASLTRAGEQARQEVQAQRAILRALRDDTAALQRTRDGARAALAALRAALAEAQGEQRALAERQAQLEQRSLALERAEAAAQQRLAELDDLEARLRGEFEALERRLGEERRDLEEQHARLRQRSRGAEPLNILSP